MTPSFIILAVVLIILLVIRKQEKVKAQKERCEKGEHDLVNYVSKWMAEPWKADKLLGRKGYYYRTVGVKLKKTEITCEHCGTVFETKWKKIEEYSSVSSDSERMDTFHEYGVVRWD